MSIISKIIVFFLLYIVIKRILNALARPVKKTPQQYSSDTVVDAEYKVIEDE